MIGILRVFFKEYSVHPFNFNYWASICSAVSVSFVALIIVSFSRFIRYANLKEAQREHLTPGSKPSRGSAKVGFPPSTPNVNSLPERVNDRYRILAAGITTRLVERAIRLQFTRQGLALISKSDVSPLDEDEMVKDALNIALGDDTGCLSQEEETSENIDVIFVEEILEKLEQEMRDRCFHDFIRLLSTAQNDPPTEEGKIAIQYFGAGVLAQGPWGLGSGKCNCGEPDCPYFLKEIHHVS